MLVLNSSQSLPLSRMKFVISRKAWYVTGCLIGMEQGGMVYLDVGGMEKLQSGELASRITVRCRAVCLVICCCYSDRKPNLVSYLSKE